MTTISPGDLFSCYAKQDYDHLQFYVKRSKEFRANTVLDATEPTPSNPGEFYSYQRLLASLMFYYPKMLLISEPGTGKSISFIEAVENSKRSGIIKRVIWFESSPNIHNDVSKQLISKAVKSDIYSYEKRVAGPDANERLEKRAERRAIAREISNFYEVVTYDSFDRKYNISSMTDQQIIDEFSGTFIVVDEAHHLTTQDGEPSKAYWPIHRVVQTAKGVRLLIISATIMTNSSLQIIPISDLLLPPDRQLTQAERKFMETEKNSPQISKLIFKKFKNYTSYISANDTKAKPVFVKRTWFDGTLGISYTNEIDSVYYTPMSGLQLETYAKYAPSSSKSASPTQEKDAVLFKGRQASTFVFPDGSIGGMVGDGGSGIAEYVEEWKPTGGEKVRSLGRYKFKQGVFVGYSAREDKTGNKLKNLSAKFKEIISIERTSFGRYLRGSVKDAGTILIYSEFKNGGGAILLSLFLERYGFSDYRKGQNISNDKIPKYALLTPEAEDQIEAVREIFNSKENVDGSRIRILIVSKALRDGINLSHAIRAHILFPAWTEASEKQAMYRIIRADSHNALYDYRSKQGLTAPIQIEIYKHAAYAPDKQDIEKSVDYIVYKNLFEKENQINLVMLGLKKAAIDYFLSRLRNKQPWNNFDDYNAEEQNSIKPVVTNHNYNAEFAIPSDIQTTLRSFMAAKTNPELSSLITERNSYESIIDKFTLVNMESRGFKCNRGYINTQNPMGIPFITHRMGASSSYDDYYYKNIVFGNIKRNLMDSTDHTFNKTDIALSKRLALTKTPSDAVANLSKIGSILRINAFLEAGTIARLKDPSYSGVGFNTLYSKEELDYASYFRKDIKVGKLRDYAISKIPGINKDNAEIYIVPGFSESATVITNMFLPYSNGIEVYGGYSDRNRFTNRKRLVRILPIPSGGNLSDIQWRYVLDGPETEVFNVVKRESKEEKKKDLAEAPADVVDEDVDLFGKIAASNGVFSIVDRRVSKTNKGRVCTTYKVEDLEEIISFIERNIKPADMDVVEFMEQVNDGKKLSPIEATILRSSGMARFLRMKRQKCEFIRQSMKYAGRLRVE